MAANAEALRIKVEPAANGARILNCGINTEGGLQAGLALARVCLANLAEVSLIPGDVGGLPCAHVQVSSDAPVLACMASQYAGWQVSVGDFFAMGSGPMRAAYGKEELFNHIPGKEQPPVAVGVLESGQVPDAKVVAHIAESLKLPPAKLTLLVAPASSQAGNVQVVARSLETTLHKLHELKFNLSQVVSGFGTAPLPPVATKGLQAIGRTNDAILYGGRVILWVRADDDQIAELGPKVPSSGSKDHGAPFAEIFARYGQDFYKIDPLLFSPAEVVFHNLKTGRIHAFGRVDPNVLLLSFMS
ncbi:MAG: methenyltetrahydromethanopterin cyclohydrolase [Gemmataceae bacterium]|nr:methenyltetrahydromethanopterin cyclohydrolase [Gemmataceae bacterium]